MDIAKYVYLHKFKELWEHHTSKAILLMKMVNVNRLIKENLRFREQTRRDIQFDLKDILVKKLSKFLIWCHESATRR